MSDEQDVNNGDAVMGHLDDNQAHIEQIQLSNLNNRSDEDQGDSAPLNSMIDEDDVPVEIHQRSTCELCKSLVGAAAGS